jgi:hypothetical protein
MFLEGCGQGIKLRNLIQSTVHILQTFQLDSLVPFGGHFINEVLDIGSQLAELIVCIFLEELIREL